MSGCGCQSGSCAGGAKAAPPAAGDASFWSALTDVITLSGLDPSAAASQIIGSDSHVNSSSRSAILASARAGQMLDANGAPAYIPGTNECSAAAGGGSNNLSLVRTGTGLALTGLQVGLTTAGVVTSAALAPFTFGISSIIGIFSTIFSHHAQAVKKEQSVLCAAVPAANNYLQIIAQAVASGQATPQQGMSALDSLVSDFQGQVSSIRNDCNAACVMTMELQAIAAVMKSQFQDLITGAQQQVAPARPNTTAPSGTAPASAYTPFFTPPAAAPSAPNTVAAPTTTMPSYAAAPPAPISAVPASGVAAPILAPSSGLPSWLPIAAVVAAGFFLLREL